MEQLKTAFIYTTGVEVWITTDRSEIQWFSQTVRMTTERVNELLENPGSIEKDYSHIVTMLRQKLFEKSK